MMFCNQTVKKLIRAYFVTRKNLSMKLFREKRCSPSSLISYQKCCIFVIDFKHFRNHILSKNPNGMIILVIKCYLISEFKFCAKIYLIFFARVVLSLIKMSGGRFQQSALLWLVVVLLGQVILVVNRLQRPSADRHAFLVSLTRQQQSTYLRSGSIILPTDAHRQSCREPCTALFIPSDPRSPTRFTSRPERAFSSWNGATNTGGWGPAAARGKPGTFPPRTSRRYRYAAHPEPAFSVCGAGESTDEAVGFDRCSGGVEADPEGRVRASEPAGKRTDTWKRGILGSFSKENSSLNLPLHIHVLTSFR